MEYSKLRDAVRAVAHQLQGGSPASAGALLRPLLELGITAGCGRRFFEKDKKHPDESLESLTWYAGELVDIVQGGAWFAVNSWLNCVDRFAPAPPASLVIEQ